MEEKELKERAAKIKNSLYPDGPYHGVLIWLLMTIIAILVMFNVSKISYWLLMFPVYSMLLIHPIQMVINYFLIPRRIRKYKEAHPNDPACKYLDDQVKFKENTYHYN